MKAAVCARLGELLARRDEDRLAPAEERLLREHLAACAACFAVALRHDPVLLFAREAAAEEMTEEARERFVADVLAATGAARAGRRIGTRRTGPGLRLAASLLLAASVAGAWLVRDREAEPPAASAGPGAATAEARPPSADILPPLEGIAGTGAVVYQFPPEMPGEPTVVFVVDRNADI